MYDDTEEHLLVVRDKVGEYSLRENDDRSLQHRTDKTATQFTFLIPSYKIDAILFPCTGLPMM